MREALLTDPDGVTDGMVFDLMLNHVPVEYGSRVVHIRPYTANEVWLRVGQFVQQFNQRVPEVHAHCLDVPSL